MVLTRPAELIIFQERRMSRKLLLALMVVALVGGVLATPARAQSNTVNFTVGYFGLRGLSGRPVDDILATELAGTQLINIDGVNYSDALLFNLKNFNGATVGGEWLFGLGDFLEGGVGVSYYAKSVPSVYANLVNGPNEIQQELRLRIVPITASIRFLPFGRHNAIEPYVGAGVGVFIWRYSETGDFVANDGTIFTATPPYVGTGTSVGPVILGGVRVPLGAFVLGGEFRYQWATGKGLQSNQFVADKIDLGGYNLNVTFGIRF